jgi:outer membrane protein assembly factor BamE (lipoprotein component of BamABCDE complex)
MKKLIAVIGVVLLMGCASSVSYTGNRNVYNKEYIDKIEAGRTSEEQLKKWFGLPSNTYSSGGRRELSFYFSRKEVGWNEVSVGTYLLTVILDKTGIVESYSVNSSGKYAD